MASSNVHHGVVHGKMIELTDSLGLPDGQEVRVIVEPREEEAETTTSEERLRRAFGAWSEDGKNLDDFLRWSREQRRAYRPEISP